MWLSVGYVVLGVPLFGFIALLPLTQGYILLVFPAVILYAVYLAIFKQGDD